MCAQHYLEFPYFTARHFLGFPLERPLDGKRTLSNASTAIENQSLTKTIFHERSDFVLFILAVIV